MGALGLGCIRLWVSKRAGIRNLFSVDDFATEAHLRQLFLCSTTEVAQGKKYK